MPAKIAETPKKKTKWRWLRVALLVAAGAILAIVATGYWMFFSNFSALRRDGTDTFYVLNASFDDPEYLYELDGRLTEENAFDVLNKTPSVYAHRLKPGEGAVFAYRWYTDGDFLTHDDEGFEKITVWLPEIPSESVSRLDLSDRNSVLAVYTKGGSAWPSSACSGYLNAGHLTVRKSDNRFVVTLAGTLSPMALPIFRELCKPRYVAKYFEATELKFDELTTWLGKPGEHPYAETYR